MFQTTNQIIIIVLVIHRIPRAFHAIPVTTRPRARPATVPLSHTRQSTPQSCAVRCHGSEAKVPGGSGLVWEKGVLLEARTLVECQD